MPIFLAVILLFAVPCLGYDVFDEPCVKYGIQKEIAVAIALQESSMKPWCVNIDGKDFYPNSKKEAISLANIAELRGRSYDVGLMQINSYWIKKLGISNADAIDPANNVTLGCWILAQEIQRHGWNWKAIGAYHSPNSARQYNYAKKVSIYYNKLKGRQK